MKQTIFAENNTFELTTGNIISIDGGLKKGSMVAIMHPQTKTFTPITAGTYILKNGGKIRCDRTGMISDMDAPTKMRIHPTRSFMSVEAPRAFFAFAKEKFFLSTKQEISLSLGLKIGSVVHLINTSPENKVPVIMESGLYKLKSGETIWINRDGKIYRITKNGKVTLRKAFGAGGPSYNMPIGYIEAELKDGRKVMVTEKMAIGSIVFNYDMDNLIPFEQGVHRLKDGRYFTVIDGGVVTQVTKKNEPKPKEPETNFSAFSHDMTSKKIEARQKLINRFNAIRK